MIHKEHAFQVGLVRWVRASVDAPHVFLSFDSAKKSTIAARQREKARGVLSGTPDTLLLVQDTPPIWCELKAPGNRPTATQQEMGDLLKRLGSYWSWCDSVEKYALWLQSIQVPLRPAAMLAAQDADAKVDGWIAVKEARPPRSYAPRAEGKNARAKKLNDLRSRVMF